MQLDRSEIEIESPFKDVLNLDETHSQFVDNRSVLSSCANRTSRVSRAAYWSPADYSSGTALVFRLQAAA